MPDTDRPLRSCDGCSEVDDHPRHVIGVALGATGGIPGCWHLDCHADAGCTSCADRLADAGGLTGDALINYFAAQREAQHDG